MFLVFICIFCFQICELKCGPQHTECELIDILVAKGARMDTRETKCGYLPIHLAIKSCRLCHVRKLIDLKSPINLSNFADEPPVVTTLQISDSEFMNALLNAGATFQQGFFKITFIYHFY